MTMWQVIVFCSGVASVIAGGALTTLYIERVHPPPCRDEALWGPGIQRQTCRFGAVGHMQTGVLMCVCPR